MSVFVTSCPHCQTCFKVSLAQINPYKGLARCGVCASTFNAREHAVEPIPEEPQDEWGDIAAPEQTSPVSVAPATPVKAPDPVAVAKESAVAPKLADAPSSALAPAPAVVRVRPSPLGRPLSPPDVPADVKDAEKPTELDQELQAQSINIPSADDLNLGGNAPAAAFADMLNDELDDDEGQSSVALDDFQQQLNKAQRRSGVWLWASLGMVCLLLLQAGWLSRHWMISAIPATQPLFAALCFGSECDLEQSFDVTKIDTGQPNWILNPDSIRPDSDKRSYELVLNIRNRSETPMPVPAVQLSVRNVAGTEIIRKVFLSSEYLPLQTSQEALLTPNAERKIVLPLELTWTEQGDASPTVDIFYP